MKLDDVLSRISTSQAAIIGLMMAGLYYATWYDSGDKLETQINSVKASIAQSQAELNRIKKAIEDAKKFQKIAEELGERMEQVLKYIPEELRISDLMKLLSSEAKAAGANILSVKDVAGSKKRDFFEEISVELKIEASFTQVLMFLSYITRVERIITLNDFAIASGGGRGKGDSGASVLSFTGNFSGYRFLGSEQPKEGSTAKAGAR